jgi:hypothetical protein
VFDAEGQSGAGFLARFFEAGTMTPVLTYADPNLTIPHPSPLAADSTGRFPQVFAEPGGVKVIVTDAGGVPQYTLDPVPRTSSAERGTFGFDGPWMDDVADLLADETLSYVPGPGKTVVAPGDYVRTRKEGFAYQVVTPAATDQHVTTDGGVKLYVLPGGDGRINLAATDLALDGTDESAAALAVLSRFKGQKLLLPYGKTLCAAGIYMNGSTWDGTDLLFHGEFKLAPAPTFGANNGFGLVWAGIEVRLCSVTINGNFFGDRSSQQQRQQTIMISQAGGYLKSDFLNFRELRGDGVYITMSEYNNGGSDPEFDFGDIYAANSEIDGRNPVTVVSCTRGTIGRFVSRNFGRINGNMMPGGLDFEPNNSAQKVRNVTVGYVDIDGVGQAPLQVLGARYADVNQTIFETEVFDANVVIGFAKIVNRVAADVADGFGAVTQSNWRGCNIEGVRGVTIGYLDVTFTNAYGFPLSVINGASDVYVRGRGRKSNSVNLGFLILLNSRQSENLDIIFDVDDVSRYGHYIQVARNSKIGGKITNPTTAHYSNRFGVIVEPNVALAVNADITGTRLSHEIPSDDAWTRAWRHGGACTYTDAVIDGARQIGTWPSDLARAGDMQIRRINSDGLTDAAAQPTGGHWLAGDFVRNRSAGAPGQPDGWVRLTTGSSHTAGVDWRPTGASVLTQATTFSGTLAHTATDETQIFSGTLTGAAVGDIITVAPQFNPMQCNFRGVIVAANTLRIFGINQSGADQSFTNPAFTVRWERRQ